MKGKIYLGWQTLFPFIMTECPHSSVYLNGEYHQQQWKGVLPLLADQVTADGKLYCSLRAFYLQSSYIHYIAAVLYFDYIALRSETVVWKTSVVAEEATPLNSDALSLSLF